LLEKERASFSVNLKTEGEKEENVMHDTQLVCGNDGLNCMTLRILQGYWNCRKAIGIFNKRASKIMSLTDVMRCYK